MLSSHAVHAKAVTLSKLALRMTTAAGSGHPSSAISLAHLTVHLMYDVMRYDPDNPWHPTADRLVLSEGHAVPIVYAAFADLGGSAGTPEAPIKLSPADVDQLRARDSVLDGHPNPAEGFPFFDAATGSLGQGLSVAGGLAAAAKLVNSPRRVFCMIGDGEAREGQIWEAADFIAERGLTNVIAIFNCNSHGQAGPVSGQQSPAALLAKLEAFGWDAVRINGHDPDQIAEVLGRKPGERPLALVAETIKGWGVDSLLDGNWHGKPVPPQALEAAFESLDRKLSELGVGDDAEKEVGRPRPPVEAELPTFPKPADAQWPKLGDACEAAGVGKAFRAGKLATRRAYGVALHAAREALPQLVVLDGDVSNSTFANIFAEAEPKRFIECKIAEQNMISVGAGCSAAGLLPFANSFAKFIARAYDQVEMANISRANLKIVGSHSGVSLAADGPSQMALLDVAYFRSLTTVRGDDRESPLCWLFHPADAYAAYACTRLMTRIDGMCYMRTHRPDVALLYSDNTEFRLRGYHVHGAGNDLAIVSAGYMVHIALEAAAKLNEQRIHTSVIDAYCLPLDHNALSEVLRKAGRVLVVEDNYGGGLGAAVCELAAATGRVRVRQAHVSRIPKSTRTAEEALDYVGVGPGQIADQALALLNEPR